VTDALTRPPVGELLRSWRSRRRLSQLELSIRADISTRHLSFVETGRARPTRTMILRLAEHLDVPLRERNTLLVAGGFAPAFAERALDTHGLESVRQAVRHVLAGLEPFPAVAVDRYWNLVDANAGITIFLEGVTDDLVAPPINVLRLSLHPLGLAGRIANLGEWRAHVLHRLRRQCEQTDDPSIIALHAELRAYPGGEQTTPGGAAAVVPMVFRHLGRELSFISTTTVFGTPLDVTVSELAIESFLPADAATRVALTDSVGPPASSRSQVAEYS
jgi:transcriptional regulator with XRE-family HTH domain